MVTQYIFWLPFHDLRSPNGDFEKNRMQNADNLFKFMEHKQSKTVKGLLIE